VTHDPRVIVLEFNELTPSLLDRFIAEGKLPNFARFRAESQVFTTDAEEQPPYLEPWIQWVTVHTGLSRCDHGVFHLNEGHKVPAKSRTWDAVSEAGRPVWVCGSMNVGAADSLKGAQMPDPWCTEVNPTPEPLMDYFRFVQTYVLEHTNDRVPLSRSDYVAFLRFMLGHGLSSATVRDVVTQLAAEVRGPERWKRVVLLDRFQYDVFEHYFRTLQPALSTFFLNSTAHYQHAYWDKMAPEAFGENPGLNDQHADAIRFGYERMDALLGRFMKLAADDVSLVFCTALSQQPSSDFSRADESMFYRVRDWRRFASDVNFREAFTSTPVMSEQFFLQLDSAATAERAAQCLAELRLDDGSPLMAVEQKENRVFTGCGIHRTVPPTATVRAGDRAIPFFDLFYALDTSKPGVHHPAGVLWIRTASRKAAVTMTPVPLTAVAPTVLSLVGMPPAPHMRTPALPVS
jgi:hypothetical protein